MIIWWPPPTGSGGGGTSTDPGVQNVLQGIAYEINGVPKTGTLNQTVIGSGLAELVAPDNQGFLEEP